MRGGTPFREAHAIVGAHVRAALTGTASLRELVADDPRLGPDAAELVGPGIGVRMRTSRGAAGPEAMPVQVEAYRAMLRQDEERLSN